MNAASQAFLRSSEEGLSNDSFENANDRVVATKEQLAILVALHERSRGRPMKENVDRVAGQTGLDPTWIRKWLSRRRCRTKTKARSSSAHPQSRAEMPPDSGSVSLGCPSILPLLDDFLVGPAYTSRPDVDRSVSAPTLPTMRTMRLGSQFIHSKLMVPSLTAAPVVAHDVDVFLAPPATSPMLSLEDADSISMLFSASSSDSIEAMDVDEPLGLAYPPEGSQLAETNEIPAHDNLLSLIDCLHQHAGQDPHGPSEPEPRIQLHLSAAQSAMLSALGLELAIPTPQQAAILAIENAGPPLLSIPTQDAVPVAFQVRLSELLACPKKVVDLEDASPELSQTGDSPLDMSTPVLSASSRDEESEDEDEVVTPGETDMKMILPDLRKHSTCMPTTIAVAGQAF